MICTECGCEIDEALDYYIEGEEPGTGIHHECPDECPDEEEEDDADPGEMDGDHESALASCGWGTDEDYGGDWLAPARGGGRLAWPAGVDLVVDHQRGRLVEGVP